jgi:hypothetical protein
MTKQLPNDGFPPTIRVYDNLHTRPQLTKVPVELNRSALTFDKKKISFD